MAHVSAQHLTRRSESAWIEHLSHLALPALLLLAFALRAFRIEVNGLNLDEAWSLWLVQHDLSFIVRHTTLGGADPSTPPVYYVLLRTLVPLGERLLVLRLVSVLAGTLIVYTTYRVAMDLLDDRRVALLATLLAAVSPLEIGLSQVARAYILGASFALVGLWLFGRLMYRESNARLWTALVLMSALATWTHYLTFIAVVFQNLYVAMLFLRRKLSRSRLVQWVVAQAVLAVLVIPALLAALTEAPVDKRHLWLERPGLQALIKSAILFGTGDPSYGPTGVTPARIISLAVIVAFCAFVAWVWWRGSTEQHQARENELLLFLCSACVVPVAIGWGISQMRPLYGEKYLLYAPPFLFILFAWAVFRSRQRAVAVGLLALLLVLTAGALHVYFTEPFGEQWREAIATLHDLRQEDEPVVMAPGWYNRPYSYYYYGVFQPEASEFEKASAVVDVVGRFTMLQADELLAGGQGAEMNHADRIWLVLGYTEMDPALEEWVEERYQVEQSHEFLGATVQLLTRAPAQE